MEFNNLAEYLKIVRINLNISQRELARRINISNTTIHKIEIGKIKKPNFIILKKISKELNLNLTFLLMLSNYTEEEIKLLKEND